MASLTNPLSFRNLPKFLSVVKGQQGKIHLNRGQEDYDNRAVLQLCAILLASFMCRWGVLIFRLACGPLQGNM